MKIAVNRCFGGFDLSDKASHPLLIQVIEELGNDVNTRVSDIEIVEIPDGVEYTIDDYDGMETVHEVHRSW